MRLLVTTESRFDRTSDGACWSPGPTGYEFWKRYLDVFEEVAVIARVRDVEGPTTSLARVDGLGVSVESLPYYVGPWQYLRRLPHLRRRSAELLRLTDAVILRAPGLLAGLVHSAASRANRPYGIEVVGDPLEVFGPGGVRSILRPLLRHRVPRVLRLQCHNACAVAYVTATRLPQRYPAGPGAFTTTYSSIDLPEESFAESPREFSNGDRPWRVIFVGSLEQMYKGPDVLIDAVGHLVQAGTRLTLTIVGGGRHQPELERRAADAGLSRVIRFTGALAAGAPIRFELDQADLFVLPSRTEGLPRAMIEAMARGVPCLGTNVGGIPDLLSPDELLPPGDSVVVAERMAELLSDPVRLTRLSCENLARARSYAREALRPRRRAFYQAVRDATIEQ